MYLIFLFFFLVIYSGEVPSSSFSFQSVPMTSGCYDNFKYTSSKITWRIHVRFVERNTEFWLCATELHNNLQAKT